MEFEFKVGKHHLEAKVNFHTEHDGIGWYEYGSITAYDDTIIAMLDKVCDCRIIRKGRCEKKEDAPACANRVCKVFDKNRNVIGYEWVHERVIDADASDAIYEAIDEYVIDNGVSYDMDEKAQMRAEDSRYENYY